MEVTTSHRLPFAVSLGAELLNPHGRLVWLPAHRFAGGARDVPQTPARGVLTTFLTRSHGPTPALVDYTTRGVAKMLAVISQNTGPFIPVNCRAATTDRCGRPCTASGSKSTRHTRSHPEKENLVAITGTAIAQHA
jgi:hypothetical protein